MRFWSPRGCHYQIFLHLNGIIAAVKVLVMFKTVVSLMVATSPTIASLYMLEYKSPIIRKYGMELIKALFALTASNPYYLYHQLSSSTNPIQSIDNERKGLQARSSSSVNCPCPTDIGDLLMDCRTTTPIKSRFPCHPHDLRPGRYRLH